MIIGFLAALLLFAPMGFFVTKGVTNHTQQTERPFLGVFYLFLALLGGLSLLSLAMTAAWSMLGLMASAGAGAVTATATDAHAGGAVAGVGGILVTVFGVLGAFIGPACAFVVAKIMAIVGLIAAFVKPNDRTVATYLPFVAAGVALFSMWPFTAYLTLGM